MGKIINLVSNDFNVIELKGYPFFRSLVAPLGLVGLIAILVSWFGWPGILPFCVVLALIPFQMLVGKINSEYFEEISIDKD